MTDTPRTKEELLAIFATNGEGAITAQDMRDLVESVAQPVAGGGLEQGKGWANGLHDVIIAYKGGLSLPVLYSGRTQDGAYLWDWSSADFVIDPEGWLGTTSYHVTNDWYGDYTASAYKWLALPPGVYDAYLSTTTAYNAPNGLPYDTTVAAFLSTIDGYYDDPIQGEAGGWNILGGTFQNFAQITSTLTFVQSTGPLYVPNHGNLEHFEIYGYCYKPSVAASVTLGFQYMAIVKVG